jgi:hypothetical protein
MPHLPDKHSHLQVSQSLDSHLLHSHLQGNQRQGNHLLDKHNHLLMQVPEQWVLWQDN